MNTSSRKKLGQWGEEIAASYLRLKGYTILQHNIRTQYGEIDLLASQADTLIFVEIKTRSSASLGLPEISITPKKFAHMISSAQSYLQAHPEMSSAWRIDVISVLRHAVDQPPEIVHFENVTHVP
jgi:putative endonuclease